MRYLTDADHDALARLLAAFESGTLTNRPPRPNTFLDPALFQVVPFINASGEEIPAFALMRFTTATTDDGEKVVNVHKPDSTYRWRYLVNGPDTVAAASGTRGAGRYFTGEGGGKILYDTGSTPAEGERWGPKSGEWKLFQHRPGFILDGRYDATEGWLYALQVPPGEVRVKNDDGGGAFAAGSGGAPRTFGIYAGSTLTDDTGLEVTLQTNASSTSWAANKYGMASFDMGRIGGVPTET